MKVKKSLSIILSALMIIALLLLLSYTMYRVDCHRVYNDSEPLFALITYEANDGGSKIYYGFFYQIICWRKLGDLNYKRIETHFIFNFNPVFT